LFYTSISAADSSSKYKKGKFFLRVACGVHRSLVFSIFLPFVCANVLYIYRAN
jgi:hypothetical protein